MFRTKKENGQTIVLIAVMLFGLMAVSALIVDGGNAYLSRRQAQTAADAAALAAANEYCINQGTVADAETFATEYALNQNKGSQLIDLDPAGSPDGLPPYILVDPATGNIRVGVEVTNSTFFAKVFGRDTTTVAADASAGCYPPGAADSVLPIAWSCRPPIPGIPSDSSDCEWKAIPWPVFQDILANPSFVPTGNSGTLLYHDDENEPETAASYLNGAGDLQLYLVMDTIPSSAEIPCIQTDPINGTVNCDLDGDGRIDILGNGDRSWLILDGDANNAQLDDIVRGELTFGVSAPTWYPGRSGAVADVYKDAVNFIEGEPALIPVFEVFCAPTSNPLTDPLCASLVEAGDGLVQISTAASGTYFRVVGFAEFYVSCVSNKLSKKCPGKEFALSLGIITQSTPSIEGYFIDGWASSDQTVGDGSALDLGIYVLSLTE